MLTKASMDDRSFGILEEFHWVPSITYKTKVRNKEKADVKSDKALDIMDLYNYK